MDFYLEIQPIKYKLSFVHRVASWWLRQTMVATESEGIRFATLRGHWFNENKNKQLLENVESNHIICLLCSVFSKRWLVYAARTNTDVCARNYLYPVFLLTKTQPRGFYQWIFIKDTPLPDWQDDQSQELGHAVYWVHL